jgi:hypothetical protein
VRQLDAFERGGAQPGYHIAVDNPVLYVKTGGKSHYFHMVSLASDRMPFQLIMIASFGPLCYI